MAPKNMRQIDYWLYMDGSKLYGDSRDQLDSLIETVRIFSHDIQITFNLDKYVVIELRTERKVDSFGVQFPEDEHIREVNRERYKYLDVLLLSQMMNIKVKEKVSSEYTIGVKMMNCGMYKG